MGVPNVEERKYRRVVDSAFFIAVAVTLLANEWSLFRWVGAVIAGTCALTAAVAYIWNSQPTEPDAAEAIPGNDRMAASVDQSNAVMLKNTLADDDPVPTWKILHRETYYQDLFFYFEERRPRTFADDFVEIVQRLNPPNRPACYRFRVADNQFVVEPLPAESEEDGSVRRTFHSRLHPVTPRELIN